MAAADPLPFALAIVAIPAATGFAWWIILHSSTGATRTSNLLEVAFLRGGIPEVIKLAAFQLVRAGYLDFDYDDDNNGVLSQGERNPDSLEGPLKIIYENLHVPKGGPSLIVMVSPKLEAWSQETKADLGEKRLMVSDEKRTLLKSVMWVGVLLTVGVGVQSLALEVTPLVLLMALIFGGCLIPIPRHFHVTAAGRACVSLSRTKWKDAKNPEKRVAAHGLTALEDEPFEDFIVVFEGRTQYLGGGGADTSMSWGLVGP